MVAEGVALAVVGSVDVVARATTYRDVADVEGKWSLLIIYGHILPKIVDQPVFDGRTAVQPSLLNFLSPKKVHHLHAIKIMDISKNVDNVNPNPVTAVQRFGIFQK